MDWGESPLPCRSCYNPGLLNCSCVKQYVAKQYPKSPLTMEPQAFLTAVVFGTRIVGCAWDYNLMLCLGLEPHTGLGWGLGSRLGLGSGLGLGLGLGMGSGRGTFSTDDTGIELELTVL